MIGRCSRLVTLASASLLVLLAACGGASEAKAPDAMKAAEPPADRDPSTIEEAQERIAAAKAELGGGGGPAAGDAFAKPPPAAPDASRPSEPSPSTPTVQRPGTTAESSPQKASPNAEDRCGSPCRALSSMRRAVTALCRMTGNEDARCIDAKRTLAASQGRIAPCSC